MKNKHIIVLITTVVATGGLLFGFDTGVISGAIPFLQADWRIDNGDIEWITAAGLLGAMLGALGGGRMSDVFGRKKIILVSAVIFAVGALWSGLATSLISLILSRLFLGIAIGVASFTVPLYIAEIAPAKSRGRLVSMFQLMVTIGILFSYLSDTFWADESKLDCWRMMLCVGVVPALILLIGMFFMPETPRWLMSKGRMEECRRVLLKIEQEDTVDDLLRQMEGEIQKDKDSVTGWSYLMQPWLRTPLMIAVCIMFFQQFVGINTVIYYSPKIFLMAGFESTLSAIWASVGIGVVNVLFTIISLYLVDKIGRRKLYFIGLSGIIVSVLCLSTCFLYANQLGEVGRWLMVGFMFAYVAFFAISIGPLGWLVISEIFPQKVRGLGTSIGSLSVWVFNCIVSFTFFKIVKAFSVSGTEIVVGQSTSENPAGAFFLYGFIALVALVWGYFFLPETRGLSLEEIERMWKQDKKG
ncbi:sugar porter family MFS transporter [Bacteroides sp.]|uniref:sugar porter family MFS transporter n=1 Tax=Bacteroides sp. TaxID=29523 RepID=UPI00260C51B1|nr:sugar porter family MFS transporter [Bacteroides sp.]